MKKGRMKKIMLKKPTLTNSKSKEHGIIIHKMTIKGKKAVSKDLTVVFHTFNFRLVSGVNVSLKFEKSIYLIITCKVKIPNKKLINTDQIAMTPTSSIVLID
ncbi:MAG: hypothetical protein ACTSVY_06225 [Candidatus Helarchaeota archaeon]